ncbi:MAG: hypothetical protein M1819_001696 [Sarea resinae]|nr:MAG: hypothetical protein M1819_001696 [Sarea resinae]
MSFVADQVRRIDAQLDRLQLSITSTPQTPSDASPVEELQQQSELGLQPQALTSPRLVQLQAIVKSLSTSSTSQPHLDGGRIYDLLEQTRSVSISTSTHSPVEAKYEQELQWLVVGKATAQVYGLILNVLLEQTIPLSNDIWYWDEILGSYPNTALYSIQTSPIRFWKISKEVFQDARQRLERLRSPNDFKSQAMESLTDRWRQFYGLVKDSIRDRSMTDVHKRMLSPLALIRTEARQKQAGLRKLREMSASGLGVLMDEGLTFDGDQEGDLIEKASTSKLEQDEWKSVVAKSITLMETVLHNVTDLAVPVPDFEDTVFASVDDPEIIQSSSPATEPSNLTLKLQNLLTQHIPSHRHATRTLTTQYGRPNILIRYWLPSAVLLLSSSTIIRILLNRRAQIAASIRDLGRTALDFWGNWVVEPTRKLLQTIRHDEASEVAIISKRSLEGDRASLERMVVDFAVDHPENSTPLSSADLAALSAKVKEGDLTPVLKAYEHDLRNPLMGTLRGNLVRALLIQVQKTKVDVEVAIGGIDALLKSQELVFGFISLTPGLFLSVATLHYLSSFVSKDKPSSNRIRTRTLHILRNIDRILSSSLPSPASPQSSSSSANSNILSYKDHGLLLCEVHVLRQLAKQLLPGDIWREFVGEVEELVDLRVGIARQARVVQRLRWGFGRYLF